MPFIAAVLLQLGLCLLVLWPISVSGEENSSTTSAAATTTESGGANGNKHFAFDASGCGIVKGCLMKPPNCTPHKDCAYAVSYVADNERVYFELLGQVQAERNAYVALGFSADGLMGGDTVTDCSSLGDAPFSARLSYNPGKSNRKVPMDGDVEAQIVHTHWAAHADGTLYCRFSQLIHPPSTIQAQFVRPLDSPVHILMSSGITQNRELSIHTLNEDSPRFPYSSPAPVSLTHFHAAPGHPFCSKCAARHSSSTTTSTTGSTASTKYSSNPTGPTTATTSTSTSPSYEDDEQDHHHHRSAEHTTVSSTQPLVQAHGVLMLFAWLLLAPFGILCGRFLRTSEQLRLCGLQIWFQIHRMANVLASLTVAAAFCSILSASDGNWTGPRWSQTAEQNLLATSVHSLFGLFAVGLTLCQPMNALFRCAPHSANRVLFNCAHRTGGYLAWLCAAIAASLACFSPRFERHFTDQALARDLMIASLALVSVSFAALQWVACRTKRTTVGPKDDENNFTIGPGVLGGDSNGEVRGRESRLIQRAILCLFLIAATALTLSIAVLIIIA